MQPSHSMTPEQGFNTLETAFQKWDDSKANDKRDSESSKLWKIVALPTLVAAIGLAGIYFYISNNRSKSTALARE